MENNIGNSTEVRPQYKQFILPRREEIVAMTEQDIGYLNDMQERLEASIAKMEVDLEFRDGGDDWHASARAALSAYVMTLKNVKAQIYRLSGRKTDDGNAAEKSINERIELKKVKAEMLKRTTESQLINKEVKAIALENRKVSLLERTSYLAIFKTVTIKHVSDYTLSEIERETCEIYEQRCREELAGVDN